MRKEYFVLLFITIGFLSCNKSRDAKDPADIPIRSDHLISASNNSYNLNPAQISAVNELLSDNTQWRLAVDSDNTNDLLPEMKKAHPGYHPYYLQTDINMDGKSDFAVALWRDSMMVLYWFGKTDTGYSRAVISTDADNISEYGYLSKAPGTISVGRLFADDQIYFEWDTVKKELFVPLYYEDPDEGLDSDIGKKR